MTYNNLPSFFIQPLEYGNFQNELAKEAKTSVQ